MKEEMKGRLFKACVYFLLLPSSLFGQKTIEVRLKASGTLLQHLTEQDIDSCTTLILHGHINSTDIRTIRSMSHCSLDAVARGQLEVLDLRDVRIDRDKQPFLTIDVEEEGMKMFLKEGGESGPLTSFMYLHDTGTNMFTSGLWHFQKDANQEWLKAHRTYIVANIFLNETDEPHTYSGFNTLTGIWFNKASEVEWTEFRRTRAYRQPGYAFVQRDGRHILEANAQKDIISDAMFYRCTSLRKVLLPKKLKIDATIKVWHKYHRYVQHNKKTATRNASETHPTM